MIHGPYSINIIVGISTYYWLEGPEFDSRWRQGHFLRRFRFPPRSRRSLRHDQEQRNSEDIFCTPKPVQTCPVTHPNSSHGYLERGVKQTDRAVDHPPHLALELEQSRPIHVLPLCAFAACNWEDSTFTCMELSCVKSCIKLTVH